MSNQQLEYRKNDRFCSIKNETVKIRQGFFNGQPMGDPNCESAPLCNNPICNLNSKNPDFTPRKGINYIK